jgi:hypothetical protein
MQHIPLDAQDEAVKRFFLSLATEPQWRLTAKPSHALPARNGEQESRRGEERTALRPDRQGD